MLSPFFVYIRSRDGSNGWNDKNKRVTMAKLNVVLFFVFFAAAPQLKAQSCVELLEDLNHNITALRTSVDRLSEESKAAAAYYPQVITEWSRTNSILEKFTSLPYVFEAGGLATMGGLVAYGAFLVAKFGLTKARSACSRRPYGVTYPLTEPN